MNGTDILSQAAQWYVNLVAPTEVVNAQAKESIDLIGKIARTVLAIFGVIKTAGGHISETGTAVLKMTGAVVLFDNFLNPITIIVSVLNGSFFKLEGVTQAWTINVFALQVISLVKSLEVLEIISLAGASDLIGKIPFVGPILNSAGIGGVTLPLVLTLSGLGLAKSYRKYSKLNAQADKAQKKKVQWEKLSAEKATSLLAHLEASRKMDPTLKNKKAIAHQSVVEGLKAKLNFSPLSELTFEEQKFAADKIKKYDTKLGNKKWEKTSVWASVAADVAKMAAATLSLTALVVAVAGFTPFALAMVVSVIGLVSAGFQLAKIIVNIYAKSQVERVHPVFIKNNYVSVSVPLAAT